MFSAYSVVFLTGTALCMCRHVSTHSVVYFRQLVFLTGTASCLFRLLWAHRLFIWASLSLTSQEQRFACFGIYGLTTFTSFRHPIFITTASCLSRLLWAHSFCFISASCFLNGNSAALCLSGHFLWFFSYSLCGSLFIPRAVSSTDKKSWPPVQTSTTHPCIYRRCGTYHLPLLSVGVLWLPWVICPTGAHIPTG